MYFVEGTYAESVFPVLDEDVVDASVLVEEPLDVPFPRVVRQVAQKHTRGITVVAPGRHDDSQTAIQSRESLCIQNMSKKLSPFTKVKLKFEGTTYIAS